MMIIVLAVLIVIVLLINLSLLFYQLRTKNESQENKTTQEEKKDMAKEEAKTSSEEATQAPSVEPSARGEETKNKKQGKTEQKNEEGAGNESASKTSDKNDSATSVKEDAQVDAMLKSGMGKSESIPKSVRKKMKGISMPEGARIGYDDLAYLTIPHYDFSGNVVVGHMVVDKDVKYDVFHIFKDLYDIKYPIERMELIDKYNDMQTEEFDSLDRSSMGRNNTSCFCYRVVSGSTKLSNHARGRAIDLNPLINPWVQGSSFSPRNAGPYVDRSKVFEDDVINRATVHANDEVVQIFEKYGWSWGGYWQSQQDYQHFEKK